MNDLVQLTNELADSMLRVAEEHVTKAQLALDQTKALVEIIRNHNKELDSNKSKDVNLQDGVVTPHRVVERSTVSDLARRGSFAGAGAGPLGKAGIGTLDPALTRDPKRDSDANYPANPERQLPRAVAGNSEFDPRDRQSKDNYNPGTGTKQPGRD